MADRFPSSHLAVETPQFVIGLCRYQECIKFGQLESNREVPSDDCIGCYLAAFVNSYPEERQVWYELISRVKTSAGIKQDSVLRPSLWSIM